MKILYNIGILIYVAAIRLLSPINSKAKLLTRGIKGWEKMIYERVNRNERNIWIHCASLGEFEQGRPIIESIKTSMPGYKIILSFFSPSGYEIRKNYSFADYVCYLPPDTPQNAFRFISAVNPELVIFVKYEFWDNYISVLSKKGIPLYLVSGIFRRGQHFFKWYGGFFRKILFRFSHIFVQDPESAELLSGIGIKNVTVAGDTRFDRVMQIAESAKTIPQLDLFRNNEKIFLAGSSWKQDEEIISKYINKYPTRMKWIFAPHVIDKANIDRIEKLFSTEVVRFSEFNEKSAGARVMIIDNIGMLSSAYRYAYIAAIGGGFGKGIHNILEAACWGIPVIFGPNHKKFREALELIGCHGAETFSDYEGFSAILDAFINDNELYSVSAESARKYVKKNIGATAKILDKINLKDINSTLLISC